MSAAFGLHFGSTSACVAICKDGKSTVVANEAGDRVTPAAVSFTNCDQIVGLQAKQECLRNAANTVLGVRLVLGKPWNSPEVQNILKGSSVKTICKDDKVAYKVSFREKNVTVSAEDVSKSIFKYLLNIANSQGCTSESHEAVLISPLIGQDSQLDKQYLRTCASAGGFNVLRVISEPSAALMAYDIGQNSPYESCNVFVYKLGGSSLNMAAVAVTSGMFRILAHKSIHELGGKVLDEALLKHFAEDFQRLNRLNCLDNDKARMKLLRAAEECKHILSTMATAQSYIESLYEGVAYQCNIARSRFEGLCSNIVQKCIEPIEHVLREANLTTKDIDKVILCGGSMKIPLFKQKLQNLFSNAECLCSIPQDELLALGASKQAAILSRYDPDELKFAQLNQKLHCFAQDISIQQADGMAPYVIVPRSSAVPLRKQVQFSLQPEQTSFSMAIMVADQCVSKIGMSALPSGATVVATFHVRNDGTLHVTCEEKTTKKSQDVVVDNIASTQEQSV